MPKPERTSEELAEMEGSVNDLENVVDEGFEGHEKGGADIKFVSKPEQDQKKLNEEKKRLSELTEMERNAVEYIKTNAQLIAGKEKLIRIAQNKENSYDSDLVAIARNMTKAPGKAMASYSVNRDRTLVIFVTKEGALYQVNIDHKIIPLHKMRGPDIWVSLTHYMESYLNDNSLWLNKEESFAGKKFITLENLTSAFNQTE